MKRGRQSPERPKILFVIKSLKSPGGAERVLAIVSSELAARGHEVSLATFDPPHTNSFYPFATSIRMIPSPVGNSGARTTPLEMAGRIVTLRRIIREHRPDVAVGFMNSSFIPLSIAAMALRLPVVASEHIVYDHYSDRFLERALIRLCAPLLSAVTAISEPMKEGFPASIRNKMTIIPNPVDPVSSKALEVAKRQKIILAVGRLEPQKDHRTLVSAFARLAPRFPGWKLRIVGEGVLRPALEQQVRDLGIEELVEMPGVIADIGKEYGSAEIFAMPSLYESFGLATAEALSYRLPVVGFSDCAGTNELVVDGVNGFLVDPANRSDALSGALARLMESPQLRLQFGKAGPAAIRHFATGPVVDRWEKLLAQVSRSPKQPSEKH